MSVTIKIPAALRSLASGANEVAADGTTIAELIDSLESQFPGMKARLCDSNGELRRFVNIFLEGEDIRFLDGLATKVADRAEVTIIPAVAGG